MWACGLKVDGTPANAVKPMVGMRASSSTPLVIAAASCVWPAAANEPVMPVMSAVLWVWAEGANVAGTFCRLVYDPLEATAARPLMSATASETAPLRPATLCTGAAAAAAAVNDITSLVECVWADGLKVAGTFDRAVYEIVGIRATANVPAVTSLAWSTTLPVRPATLCTGAKLDTAVVP